MSFLLSILVFLFCFLLEILRPFGRLCLLWAAAGRVTHGSPPLSLAPRSMERWEVHGFPEVRGGHSPDFGGFGERERDILYIYQSNVTRCLKKNPMLM